MNNAELIERFPLCVACNLPVACELEEQRLEISLDLNTKVVLKLQAGIEPTPLEEKACTLPYDLPGEKWKEIPNSDDSYYLSNKRRLKRFYKETNSFKYVTQYRMKHKPMGVSIFIRGRKTFISTNKMVYLLFDEYEIRPMALLHRKQYEENMRILDKVANGEMLSPEEVFRYTLPYDLPNEEWRPIKGMEGYYEISSCGRVRNCEKKTILYGRCNRDRYNVIHTSICGVDKSIIVHRCVAQAFIPKTEEDIKYGRDFVNHKDGNKLNNRVENLEWCTRQENVLHARDTGLLNVALTHDLYKEAVKLYKEGLYCGEIADRLNVSRRTIARTLFGSLHANYDKEVLTKHKQKTTAVKLTVDNPRSRYKLDDVLEILIRLKHNESARSIANIFKCDHHVICRINSGKRYSEVKLEDYPERVAELEKKLYQN